MPRGDYATEFLIFFLIDRKSGWLDSGIRGVVEVFRDTNIEIRTVGVGFSAFVAAIKKLWQF